MLVLVTKSPEELTALGAKEVTQGNSSDKHGPRFSHTHKLIALVEGKDSKMSIVESVADLTQMKLAKARFFMLANSEVMKIPAAKAPVVTTPVVPPKPPVTTSVPTPIKPKE